MRIDTFFEKKVLYIGDDQITEKGRERENRPAQAKPEEGGGAAKKQQRVRGGVVSKLGKGPQERQASIATTSAKGGLARSAGAQTSVRTSA